MAYRILAFFGLLFLASCGPSQQTLAVQQFKQMDASCAAQYPDQPPTMAAYMRCRNAADNATLVQYVPNPDIYQAFMAERLAIADQADSGQITLDQANAEIALAKEQANQASIERNNQDSEALAQRQEAAASLANAMKPPPPAPIFPYFAPTQPIQPIQPIQPTIITNCSNYGNQVNCISH